jgi:glycosyltransferase involved in cell wall biosynthesis
MVNYLPIVCSDAGGISEVVWDNFHGLMFPVKNTEQLLARLCDALSHPAKMHILAGQARKRIEEFSAERMVENYLAVFRQLFQSDQSFTAPVSCTIHQDDTNRR